ncbi:hypothetical protein MMC07_004499 [Pseudocyphellaria aurata]|nr:hypothetical protein [Pseudocyphellaria aurata]
MRVRVISPIRPKKFYPPRGEKQIFLPNFTLTLLRTPHSPPHFASFLTPLYLNKIDLKDYLWHGYGLQVLGVRSYVIQSKVQQDKSSRRFPSPRRWFRPRATKKMTVELVQNAPGQGPFVWPEPPTDFTPWSQKTWKAAKKSQEEAGKRTGPRAARMPLPDDEVATLADQAKALREGRATWVPGWADHGGARLNVTPRDGRPAVELGVSMDKGWSYGMTR